MSVRMANTLKMFSIGYQIWAILVLAVTFGYAQQIRTHTRIDGRNVPKTIVYDGASGMSNQQRDSMLWENRDRIQQLDGDIGQLRAEMDDMKAMHLENRLTKLESSLEQMMMLLRGTAIGVGVMLMSSLLNSVIKFRKA